MNLGPYTLFDIIDTGVKELFQVTEIDYDIEEPLNHSLTPNNFSPDNKTLETCKEHNDGQVSSINQSIEEVRGYLSANPDSTKRKNQLEYLSNSFDHFVNWYKGKGLLMPDKPPAMESNKGSFSANKDFSEINLDNKPYRLRRNQPKIVELLFKNLMDELDGLSYPEIARKLDLTASGKLSNYFKDSPRVKEIFYYSRRTGKYSLKH